MANFRIDDLVCPVCKLPLTEHPEKDGLVCGHCHRIYPIRDGIPVLLEDEAIIEEA